MGPACFFCNGNHLDFNGTVLVNADLIVLFTVRPKEFNLISFHKPLDPIFVAVWVFLQCKIDDLYKVTKFI